MCVVFLQGACVQEAANPVIEERIKQLLREGVKSVSEMRRRIREFVKGNLYSGEKPLPFTRYRYYTLHQNLRNIMKTAQDAAAHSSGDQEKLQVRRNFFVLELLLLDRKCTRHTLVNTNCAFFVLTDSCRDMERKRSWWQDLCQASSRGTRFPSVLPDKVAAATSEPVRTGRLPPWCHVV